MSIETDCVRGGLSRDEQFGSLMTPLHLTSTYVLEGIGKDKGYDYTRSGNPTRTELNKHLDKTGSGRPKTKSPPRTGRQPLSS